MSQQNSDKTNPIRQATLQMIDYLGTADAIDKAGCVWCTSEQIILRMRLSSLTTQEAESYLKNELVHIREYLTSK